MRGSATATATATAHEDWGPQEDPGAHTRHPWGGETLASEDPGTRTHRRLGGEEGALAAEDEPGGGARPFVPGRSRARLMCLGGGSLAARPLAPASPPPSPQPTTMLWPHSSRREAQQPQQAQQAQQARAKDPKQAGRLCLRSSRQGRLCGVAAPRP